MRTAVALASPELELLRSLIASHSGIDLGRHRGTFLETRVRRRMAKTGARSLYEYYRMVTAAQGAGRELQSLMEEVSIHETCFFRNPHQFQTLESLALPERVRARLRQGKRRLRIWSAGCSSGQEPYSIAISCIETVVVSESWDLKLYATDISGQVVAQARIGAYAPTQVEGLSPLRLQRFFRRAEGVYTVRPWLRRRVEFRVASVLDGPPEGDVDVVFCRNVMIYFDAAGQRRLVSVLADAVAPGGFLFLGHTESLAGASDAFRMVAVGRGIAYQRLP
jgi:chemotaxis protein methyltransferase CheR